MTTWLKRLLGLVAVALLAIPFVIGLVAQPKLAALTEQVQLHSTPAVTVVAADTKRGWFRSQSRIAVDLHAPRALAGLRALGVSGADKQSLPLDLNIDLRHGLVPLATATVDIYAGAGADRQRLPIDITVSRGLDATHWDTRWQFATPSGAVSGTLAGVLADGRDTSLGARIARTNATADLSIPIAVATALARTLDYGGDDLRFVLHAGYLRSEGDFYRSDVTLRDAQLTVNGEAVPLPF